MVIFNPSALYLTMAGWMQGFFTSVHQMECTETRKVKAALILLWIVVVIISCGGGGGGV
jgi:hypothetical protein